MVKKTLIKDFNNLNLKPYCSACELTNQLGISRSTVNQLRAEMREHEDRYGPYAVISGGISLTSYVALIDYITYRTQLRDKYLCNTVPSFNPTAIAYSIGWSINYKDKEDTDNE